MTIDAIACDPAIAAAITARGGDYLLVVKANPPTHCRDHPPFDDPAALTAIDKSHGWIESRRAAVSREIDWLTSDLRYLSEPGFVGLKAIAMLEAEVERGRVTTT